MNKYSIAYFGTPGFSAMFLEKLLADKEIPVKVEFVVTRHDKAVGRKQIITPSPVKQIALKNNISVIDDLKKLQVISYKLQELDFAFLFAYGGFIPDNLLHQPRYGFLNTHPSLLPKYRGASPMAYPLILGDTETGVTFIQLDEKLDQGPIISQEKVGIAPTDLRSDLENKLTELSFQLFKKQVEQIADSQKATLKFINQDNKAATYTQKFTKEDGFISFSIIEKALNNSSLNFAELPKPILRYIEKYHLTEEWKAKLTDSGKIIYDYFRGLYPWPGIWTRVTPARCAAVQQKRLKITNCSLTNNKLIIKKVQLEGKKEVDFITFNKAYKIL
ncbi:MAG: Methionyl-tRNA formyltransferase [Parcubacteria group bacterium GW2011_GWC2_45_7]|uniref:methionyl-tRNA formyltransferase n=1 Tax=Candidatus Roizmanbacteria bacterium GW2011_GWA2_36_23 TaxID=1618480 RepID=A0A0G0HCP0_9BACT|nr:MAG: Methionyl-tRNA formyltransferase [Candidatus Roizmanbacteria bacterium GW2011_GWA2_36_23]KKU12764.1 MAG: Methionyl-tRNA formyltransferase [Parcubacteria group bacterium GW2011_GWC2_45_7]